MDRSKTEQERRQERGIGRKTEMDRNVLTFAKVLVDSNGQNHCGITSDVYHAELEKLARENKRDGESLQQAYVRMSEQTESGRLLMKAALWGPAPVQAAQDFVNPRPEPIGEASKELEELARYMARSKNWTYERAYSELYTDPERKALVDRVKREEADTTARVRAQRFPMPEEQGEAGAWRLGRSPGSRRM
jgi:hypothetical protein